MADQLPSDRFKAEMPHIPGVSGPGFRRQVWVNTALRWGAGFLVVLLLFLLGSRWLTHPKRANAPPEAPPPQIEVPPPAADPSAALPHVTEQNPDVATVSEMAKPWSVKDFFFVNHTTGENVPALLIRLPGGSPNQPGGYWALAMNTPFGNCQFEYVKDIAKLKSEYDFRAAVHPMVGNPCSRTLFDPLRLSNIPGNIWVRGAIVQGSDVRPPLGIEVKIQGKNILAIRME
jgi:hypothetical protein